MKFLTIILSIFVGCEDKDGETAEEIAADTAVEETTEEAEEVEESAE